jgi:hypothetical protein
MSNSKAKKERMKRVREGKRNPESSRGSWKGVNPMIQKTPTLQEKKVKLEKKYKSRWNPSANQSEDSFFQAISESVDYWVRICG